MQRIRNFLLFVLITGCYAAQGQETAPDTSAQKIIVTAAPAISSQDSLAHERINLNKTHMTILGAWATANIVQGAISSGNATGSARYLHQMNIYFNTVNFALAGINLLLVKKQLSRRYSLADNIKEQSRIEKILLLNMGLDATYIATGLYLKERGMRLGKDQPQGYGNSLLIQGGFLLVFDIIQYAGHRKNGKWLENNMSGLKVGATNDGFGLSYKFK